MKYTDKKSEYKIDWSKVDDLELYKKPPKEPSRLVALLIAVAITTILFGVPHLIEIFELAPYGGNR